MNFEKHRDVCDWAILNSSISDPSSKDLREALQQFFRYSDEEHPSAWLHCGTDEGPLFSLTVYGSRRTWYGRRYCDIEFIKYDDQDMNVEIEKRALGTFFKSSALDLWKNFIAELLSNKQS